MKLLSASMEAAVSGSSMIRKMFEQGLELKRRFGADNVYDFSLGNPDLRSPSGRRAALSEKKKRQGEIKMDNIILIGMPGCGKSTVGVVLAKAMGYRFLDSDLLIQETDGRLLCNIIEEEGIRGFNEIENRINASIDVRKTVIATGGSVVYGREAMEHLKSIGTVVYIRLPLSEIKKRLGDLTKRGVSIREGQSLEELYEERAPLYERYADITADEKDMTISETALYIRDMVKNIQESESSDNK